MRSLHRATAIVVAAFCALVPVPAVAGTGTAVGLPVDPHLRSTAPLQPEAKIGPAAVGSAARARKVMIIAFENKPEAAVFGAGQAPYLTRLAKRFGRATRMDAGYPPRCPSLAAYLLITSGRRYGICDDKAPAAHPISADNVFHQVARSGRRWRAYAEALPEPCPKYDHGRFLIRHLPSAYYTSERGRCRTSTVPLGSPTAGPLHQAITTGKLPAYSFVTPDACHDMHGLPGTCPPSVRLGDGWLHSWIPDLLAGPDFRSGRLVVIVTFDEGSLTDNHIATVVLSKTTRAMRSRVRFTHCSTLRTTEELLGLPLLGCARRARSMVRPFGL